MIRKALGISTSINKAIKPDNYNFNGLSLLDPPVVFYNWNQADYIEKGYKTNAEVYKIIRKIVEKCQVANLELYVDNGEVKSKSRRHYHRAKYSTIPVEHIKKQLYIKALDYAPENSKLFQLLQQPNPYQTRLEFDELFDTFYHVQGEVFVAREVAEDSDVAMELYIIPPSKMRHIQKDGVIKGWQYDMGNGKTRTWQGEDLKDILHVKMSNPLFDDKGTQLRGFPPLLAGMKYLQLDDYAVKAWIKSLQNEGAKGIISPNHPDSRNWLNEKQIEELEGGVQDKIHGIENKNKVVVSGMPLQYTQIGLSPEALNIIASIEKAGDNLCDLWNVPAVLFEKNPTYQNQKEGAMRLVRDVVIPYLNKKEDALNRWLVEPFRKKDNKNYVLDYDTSLYDELRLSREEKESLKGYLSINERRILDGYDEIENEYANEVFVQQGMIPLSDFSFGVDRDITENNDIL